MTTELTGANSTRSRWFSRVRWFVCVLVALYVGSWGRGLWMEMQDDGQRGQAMVGCFSDSFYQLEAKLAGYAGAHEGRFPSGERLTASFSGKELICAGNNQPLGWNPQLQNISTHSNETRLLVWCPIGAHGDYSGAILLTNHQLKSVVVKADRLAALMDAELKLLSVEAKSR